MATISIHALHEESDEVPDGFSLIVDISIHALHEESERPSGTRHQAIPISIHALHEESDGSPAKPSAFH